MTQPLEQRIREANITHHARQLHPEDLYLDLKYYVALNNLNYEVRSWNLK